MPLNIDEILERTNALEIYRRYVDLEQHGTEWVGKSPFNPKDTNPSFTVTEANGLFYDFSVGIGSNVIGFLQKVEKIPFRDALAIVCESIGEDVADVQQRLAAIKELRRFQQAQKSIKSAKPPKPIDKDIMAKYDWNEDKLRIWHDEGISWDVMSDFGVKYDPVSDAICFPIYSNTGALVNVKKRNLSPNAGAKYIYTHKWDGAGDDILFNLHKRKDEIKKQGEVLIFESEKAVMMCESAGMHNALALATSHLSQARCRVLAELGVPVVFCLDKEIKPWLDKSIQSLKRYVRVEYLLDTEDLLPEKASPIDLGADVFWKLYEGKRSLS